VLPLDRYWFPTLYSNPGEFVIRPILNFGLSFNHSVVDGGYSVQFLRWMIEHLEDPDSWLLEII